MLRLRTLSLFLVTAALASACSGSTKTQQPSPGDSDAGGTGGTTGLPDAGTDSATPESLQGKAFDIQVPLPDSGYPWCQGDCTPATVLVSHVDASSLELVWGATGRAGTLSLTPVADGWKFDGSLLLGTYWSWDHAMCANESNLGPATFDFADHDHDGQVDLVINGYQVSKMCSDDYSTGSEGDVVLSGGPDSRAPKLLGPDTAIEPLHGVTIQLDKPLDGAATCALVPQDGTTSVALEPEKMNGYVVGFSTTQVLPLGGRYTAQVTGVDFAGIGSPSPFAVSILDDFGVLAQDGFESGSTSGISGATIVDSWGVPALNGQRMLVVQSGTPALLHLRRVATEQSLVMDVRKVDECWGMGWDGPFELKVGVVGADTVADGSVSMGANPTSVALEGGTISVGDRQTVTVPLTGAGEDVVVYLRGDYYQGAGCSKVGALLDDVRLQ